jgi:hypothetical protein
MRTCLGLVAFFVLTVHFVSGKHFDRCELARSLVQDHSIDPEQLNDCKISTIFFTLV